MRNEFCIKENNLRNGPEKKTTFQKHWGNTGGINPKNGFFQQKTRSLPILDRKLRNEFCEKHWENCRETNRRKNAEQIDLPPKKNLHQWKCRKKANNRKNCGETLEISTTKSFFSKKLEASQLSTENREMNFVKNA